MSGESGAGLCYAIPAGMPTIAALEQLTAAEHTRLIEALYFAILSREQSEQVMAYTSDSSMLSAWKDIHAKLSGADIGCA